MRKTVFALGLICSFIITTTLSASNAMAAPRKKISKKSKIAKARTARGKRKALPAPTDKAFVVTPAMLAQPVTKPDSNVIAKVAAAKAAAPATAKAELVAKPVANKTNQAFEPTEPNETNPVATEEQTDSSVKHLNISTKTDFAAAQKEFEEAVLTAPLRAEPNWMTEWSSAQQENLERAWYSACYTVKDNVACFQFSKLLLANFPTSSYSKNARERIFFHARELAWQDFQNALAHYYQDQGNTKKLERIFQAGEPLSFMPYVIAQMALAGANAILFERIEPERVKAYIERALQVFDSVERRGTDLAQEDWEIYRVMVMAAGNQALGMYTLKKLSAFELASLYFSRAIAIKSPKTSQGWKDPVNYFYRAEATYMLYAKARLKYDALSAEQKNGESGKTLLIQINLYLQQVIEDYARIMALVQSNRREFGTYEDFTKSRLQELLHADPNRDKTIQDLIKRFQAEFAA